LINNFDNNLKILVCQQGIWYQD